MGGTTPPEVAAALFEVEETAGADSFEVSWAAVLDGSFEAEAEGEELAFVVGAAVEDAAPPENVTPAAQDPSAVFVAIAELNAASMQEAAAFPPCLAPAGAAAIKAAAKSADSPLS